MQWPIVLRSKAELAALTGFGEKGELQVFVGINYAQ
jgi:hypothetical protein